MCSLLPRRSLKWTVRPHPYKILFETNMYVKFQFLRWTFGRKLVYIDIVNVNHFMAQIPSLKKGLSPEIAAWERVRSCSLQGYWVRLPELGLSVLCFAASTLNLHKTRSISLKLCLLWSCFSTFLSWTNGWKRNKWASIWGHLARPI